MTNIHSNPTPLRQKFIEYLTLSKAERKQAASAVNLTINAVRSFYGGLLQRQIEPLLHQT
jgi:hypothetical protein